jgi:hypothetical protein
MSRRFLAPPLFVLLAACGGSVVALDGGSDDAGAGDASPDVDGGGVCTPGETHKIDCNTCTCMQNGQWACTGLACIDSGPGPMSDPGVVTCAGAPCKVPGNYCCDQALVPTPSTQKCVPDSTSACGGLRQACDEAADCNSGDVCCVPPNANIRIALDAQCSPKGSCKDATYAPQLCRTSAECDNGQSCVQQLCLGAVVWSCGGIDPKRCQ